MGEAAQLLVDSRLMENVADSISQCRRARRWAGVEERRSSRGYWTVDKKWRLGVPSQRGDRGDPQSSMAHTGARRNTRENCMNIHAELGVHVADEGFLTVAEACAFLRVSRSFLYSLIGRGTLPSARFGRSRRIPRRALIAFASRCVCSLN